MDKFEPGKVLRTNFGSPITIDSYIAGGGQGDVYKVTYDGKKKALKWYKPGVLKDPNAFYENLEKNAKKGSPDKAFFMAGGSYGKDRGVIWICYGFETGGLP